MIRKILSAAVLCGLSMSAFAMTCPPKSAFNHIPGRNWGLDAKYRAQGWMPGWEIYPTGPDVEFLKNTHLTKLDNRSSIFLNVRPDDYYTASCFYTLPGETQRTISVVTRASVDEDNIHMPPYVRQYGTYICNVTEKINCDFPIKPYPAMKEPIFLK